MVLKHVKLRSDAGCREGIPIEGHEVIDFSLCVRTKRIPNTVSTYYGVYIPNRVISWSVRAVLLSYKE